MISFQVTLNGFHIMISFQVTFGLVKVNCIISTWNTCLCVLFLVKLGTIYSVKYKYLFPVIYLKLHKINFVSRLYLGTTFVLIEKKSIIFIWFKLYVWGLSLFSKNFKSKGGEDHFVFISWFKSKQNISLCWSSIRVFCYYQKLMCKLILYIYFNQVSVFKIFTMLN